jgi:FkbM family methyltransferase
MKSVENTRWYKYIKSLVLSALPRSFLAPLKRVHYARRLATFKPQDESEYPVIRKLVSPGMKVIDIGANVGFFTRILSELVGPEGCVASIEAVPFTFEILKHNLRKLGLSNVKPINYAVSDRKRKVRMFIPKYPGGGINYYASRVTEESGTEEAAGRSLSVQALPMDRLFPPGSGRVGFIKCDVEWHELACLRGSIELIRRDRPAWVVEILGDPDDSEGDAAAVFSLMEAEGYEAWWFNPRGRLEPLDENRRRTAEMVAAAKARSWDNNYYFLTEEQVRQLKKKAPELFLP